MAGGIRVGDDDDGITGINVTPFVDIALVLLIIFMVTAKYITSQSIPMELPKASTGQSQAPDSAVSVSIDNTQKLFVDTRPVDEAQLLATLRNRYVASNEVRAVISADRTVPHGRVTQVIDLVRQAGVTKFAIQTEQPVDEPQR